MQKKLKEIKPGEKFIFGGYEWIRLEQEGLVLTKDVVNTMAFDENYNKNDFDSSDIKNYLEKNFYNRLMSNGAKRNDFEIIILDFTADDGTENSEAFYNLANIVGLLSADLYRKNRHLLPPINANWWLATPKSYLKTFTSSVMAVTSYGTITTEYTDYAGCGVRPLCKLSDETEIEVDCPSEETETENITELIKKLAEEKNLAQRPYYQHIYRLIQNISDLTRHIEEEDYNEAKHDLGYIYAKLVILAKKLSDTDDEDYTSFLINEIEAGRSIW